MAVVGAGHWPVHDFDDEIATAEKHQPAPVLMRTVERHVEPETRAIECGGTLRIFGRNHHVIQRGDGGCGDLWRARAISSQFQKKHPHAPGHLGCGAGPLPGQGGAGRRINALDVGDGIRLQRQAIEPAMHF